MIIKDVSEKSYHLIKDALLKAFYYQRCGTELKPEHAGKWVHKACHINKAVLYENREINIEVSGGWHDAGDYGKYVVPAAKAIADLLLSYELNPSVYQNQINIPESGNGIPDILNEVRYEIEWMLKMQDIVSGAVYHKVSTMNFPGFIMPEDDLELLVVSPISSTATATFAASLALAARIYKEFDQHFAEKLLTASQNAWEWLEANPEYPPFVNPEGMNSGEYRDDNDKDERFWAAVELYKVTGEGKYHTYIKQVYNQANFDKLNFGWADVGGYATIEYLTLDSSLIDKQVYNHLFDLFINRAERIVEICNLNDYYVALNDNEYIWGSNMLVLNRAMHLIYTFELTNEHKYCKYAKAQLEYILGNNPLNVSFITGIGINSPKYPHHRPSGADAISEPVPGLLVGGPNSRFQDEVVKKFISKDTMPSQVYIDHEGSYSTNEVAIYWNSPAVFVISYFCE